MTKKQKKLMMVGSVVIIMLLLFGIFKLNKYYDDKHQEEIALEMEERAKEEERLEKIELEKKKAEEERKKEETAKLREQFRKDAEKNKGTSQGNNQGTNSNTGTGKVPEPETIKATDNQGNKITVTKVPKINPNSVPDEVEKPSKKEPAPTVPPKENSNATVTKPPTSAKDEGTNNSTYPNTKPTEENKTSGNTNTGNNNGVYNPFTDPNVPASKPRSSNSEDIGDPNKKMGQGDKF